MSEPVIVALIVSTVGPAVLFGLNRVFGGWRRDRMEADVTVASQWQAWSQELRVRVDDLEEDVAKLKADLASERTANQRLQDQNRRQGAMLTALIRWAILLRDEVIRLGGKVPPAPVEVEAAMTTLDP